MDEKIRRSKEKLMDDFMSLMKMVHEKQYGLSSRDIFAFGYLAGKYNLEMFFNNQNNLMEACKQYDETDDLALLDTVGEVFIDLELLDNSKGEI